MTQIETVLSVITFVFFSSFTALIYFRFYRKSRARATEFRLYALRDKMIDLVVSGKIKEHDFVFQEFYKFINYMTNHCEELSFSTLIQISRQNKKDFQRQQYVDKLIQELSKKDEKVIETIAELSYEMAQIFISSSLLLRFLVTSLLFLRLVERIVEKIPNPLLIDEIHAYEEYKKYDTLHDRIMSLQAALI